MSRSFFSSFGVNALLDPATVGDDNALHALAKRIRDTDPRVEIIEFVMTDPRNRKALEASTAPLYDMGFTEVYGVTMASPEFHPGSADPFVRQAAFSHYSAVGEACEGLVSKVLGPNSGDWKLNAGLTTQQRADARLHVRDTFHRVAEALDIDLVWLLENVNRFEAEIMHDHAESIDMFETDGLHPCVQGMVDLAHDIIEGLGAIEFAAMVKRLQELKRFGHLHVSCPNRGYKSWLTVLMPIMIYAIVKSGYSGTCSYEGFGGDKGMLKEMAFQHRDLLGEDPVETMKKMIDFVADTATSVDMQSTIHFGLDKMSWTTLPGLAEL